MGKRGVPLKYKTAEDIKERCIVTESGCWEWQGANDRGYGMLGNAYPSQRAHRMAYMFVHGPLESSQFVCHSCDNPPCCNPDHMFVGSNSDNQRDMARKGRHGLRVSDHHCGHGTPWAEECIGCDVHRARVTAVDHAESAKACQVVIGKWKEKIRAQ